MTRRRNHVWTLARRLAWPVLALAVGTAAAVGSTSAQSDDDGGAPRAAGIHLGTCASLEPNPAYPLVNVGMPSATNDDDDDGVGSLVPRFRGSQQAARVEASGTEVAVGLDALLSQPYSIIVGATDGESPLAACGEIGGFAFDDDENGMVVGLRGQGGTISGLAFLDDDDDDGQLEVRIFLVDDDPAVTSATTENAGTGGNATGGVSAGTSGGNATGGVSVATDGGNGTGGVSGGTGGVSAGTGGNGTGGGFVGTSGGNGTGGGDDDGDD